MNDEIFINTISFCEDNAVEEDFLDTSYMYPWQQKRHILWGNDKLLLRDNLSVLEIENGYLLPFNKSCMEKCME